MFEKLTPRMEKIIRMSQQIAREYDQEHVGTEHLLLAILREGSSMGAEILQDASVDLVKAKAAIDRFIQASMEDTWVFGRLPGTPHFRNVMATAIEEARQLESKYVCAEHLLLALAREEGSVASTALAEMGLRAGAIRASISKRMAGNSPETCGVDDED